MASSVISTTLTYVGDQANELIFEPLFMDPELTDIFTVWDNVHWKKKINVSHTFEKIVKAYAGCGWNPSSQQYNVSDKWLQVEDCEVQLEFCADTFDQTVFAGLKSTGVKRNDITGTIIQEWILHTVTQALKRDVIRLALYDSKSKVTAGYGILDGIWQQIFNGIASYDITNYANIPVGLADCDAKKYLRALIDLQSDELLELDDEAKMLLVGKNIWRNWKKCLQDGTGGNLIADLAWQFNQNNKGNNPQGGDRLKFDNVPLTQVRMQDRWLKSDFNNAQFNRMLVTDKNNLILGTEAYSDTDFVEIWYDKTTDKVRIQARFKLGTSYALGKLISVQY